MRPPVRRYRLPLSIGLARCLFGKNILSGLGKSFHTNFSKLNSFILVLLLAKNINRLIEMRERNQNSDWRAATLSTSYPNSLLISTICSFFSSFWLFIYKIQNIWVSILVNEPDIVELIRILKIIHFLFIEGFHKFRKSLIVNFININGESDVCNLCFGCIG